MKYTIIIPVFNRPEEIDELLSSLEEQSYKNFNVIVVEDQSEGIDDDMADRIFDPFVTNSDKNMGLGLSIAKRIAENHDGTIFAENMAAGGARFTFLLPQRIGNQ